ncbi:MAG: sigma factor, partial [Eubacteriales bacterium]|nr:sigma factor [Eubacteriales bacterium]
MNRDLYNKVVECITKDQDRFYRLAYSYVRNQEDALDVVQSSVCKALEHYKDIRSENAIKTWFYR